MRRRIEAVQYRELKRRNVRLWIHEHKRYEHAVIKTSIWIDVGGEPCVFEYRGDFIRKIGRSSRWVVDMVCRLREAVVIVDERGSRSTSQCSLASFPVRADHKYRIKPPNASWKFAHKSNHCRMAWIAEYRQRTATV